MELLLMDGDLVKLAVTAVIAYFLVLRPVFSYLSNRMLVAGVAAELKAQCDDQELVKEVCFSDFGMGFILSLKNRFPKNMMRFPMITSFLLAEVVISDDFDRKLRASCVGLLNDRLMRFYSEPQGWVGTPNVSTEDVLELKDRAMLGSKCFMSSFAR
jgi:hypothetical protein